MRDFNLIISTSRGNERNACSEAWYLLREVGDPNAIVETTGIIGLLVSNTTLNPVKAVNDLRNKLIERPWEFRYVLKFTPIQAVTESSLEAIEAKAMELSSLIEEGESYRITVEKRRTKLKSTELIEAIAPKLEKKVKLKDPDRVLLIEVIGKLTGISIIKPNDVLSVEREKRDL